MEHKIKKILGILDNIDCDVWYCPEACCGSIILRDRCVTSTVIDLITKVVDLVAISCIDTDIYRITFTTK